MLHDFFEHLIIDHDPKYLDTGTNQHNEAHRILTEQLNLYLWTLPEIQELVNLQSKPKLF